ncbi:CG14292 [Drosophila busckii]|uniref:CG14292 n=1 Tax=Drosophila busckii TaxID=30019 RepID=A0A0M4F416_DROBS|nr:uncharacterized protein LOC108602458 [Drosophila busckii]ALC46057.1 CG14292 [Drosophila busckii]
MKFAILLLAVTIACANAQGPVFGGFAAANPYASAFNPYLNGMFANGPPGAAAAPGAAPAAPAVAPPAPTFGGFSVTAFFQSVVLQKEAEKLLNQPNFPADLAERVQDVMTNTQTSFANCGTAVLPWMQIRCIKPILMAAKNELKAIDDEFQARLAATTAAPAAAPAGPKA